MAICVCVRVCSCKWVFDFEGNVAKFLENIKKNLVIADILMIVACFNGIVAAVCQWLIETTFINCDNDTKSSDQPK